MYNEKLTNNEDIVFVTDFLENIKERDKDAFRIIVSSGVSEEKDAKELIIDTFIDEKKTAISPPHRISAHKNPVRYETFEENENVHWLSPI